MAVVQESVYTTVPFVNLQRIHSAMGDELERAFRRACDTTAFTLGRPVESFENDFATYVGAMHGVGVGSGTDALFLALKAYGVGPGDEVITAANTFAATAEAIVMVGATPVFVDVREDTLLMDLDAVEPAITDATKVIIPVHLYGQPVDMTRLMAIARPRGIRVIEDACQSHGARCGDRRTGSLGDAGCFSFYPSKNLGALGDGGIVTTDDGAIASRIRLLRNHGEDSSRLHVEPGYCTRLHALQAGFLSAKLPYLDRWNESRVRTAEKYSALLKSPDVTVPFHANGVTHVHHLFVVRVPHRDAVRGRLDGLGIQTGIHYAVPLHLEPAFESLGYARGDFPVAEKAAGSILSLPMFPFMEDNEITRVADAVLQVVGRD